MRQHYVITCGVLLTYLICAGVQGQVRGERYEIGPELTTVLLVKDPSCPLQLREPSKVHGYETGAVVAEFILENVSDHSVESFVVEQTNWLGNEGRSHRAETSRERWVFGPTVTYSSFDDSPPFHMLSLDSDTAKKFRFSSLENKVLILMVTKVKLSGGKTYDSSSKFAELEKFLLNREIESNIGNHQLETEMRRTREYIATMLGT